MTMALKTRGLPVTRWQDVLPATRYSARLLIVHRMRDSSNLRGDLPAGDLCQRGSPHLVLSYSNVMFEQVKVTLWSTKSSCFRQIHSMLIFDTLMDEKLLCPFDTWLPVETFDDSSQQSPDDNTTPTTSEDTTALDVPSTRNPCSGY